MTLGFLYLVCEDGGSTVLRNSGGGTRSEGVELYFQFCYAESAIIVISSNNHSHALNAYYISRSVMSILCPVSHLILTGWYYCHSHFTAEALRSQIVAHGCK